MTFEGEFYVLVLSVNKKVHHIDSTQLKSPELNCSLNYDNHNNDVDDSDNDDKINFLILFKELDRSNMFQLNECNLCRTFFFKMMIFLIILINYIVVISLMELIYDSLCQD